PPPPPARRFPPARPGPPQRRLPQTAAGAGSTPEPPPARPAPPAIRPRSRPRTGPRTRAPPPLVPRPPRKPRLALRKIRQLPGEQLDVRPADPRPPDVHHHLPRPRRR